MTRYDLATQDLNALENEIEAVKHDIRQTETSIDDLEYDLEKCVDPETRAEIEAQIRDLGLEMADRSNRLERLKDEVLCIENQIN